MNCNKQVTWYYCCILTLDQTGYFSCVNKVIVGCTCVIYWPSTKPSIKRCTCVNKWKNSGSRWALENNITRCPGGSSQLETRCQSENQLQIEGFGPLVTPGWATQAKMRKKCCYSREKNLGQYSSPSLSPLISHTQQTSPFRKESVRNLYFYKEVFIVHYRLMMFPHVSVYL